MAGTWTLIVDAESVAGDEISQQFTGNIQFDKVSVHASGLPDSAHSLLAAGAPVKVPVSITNKGAAAEEFFADPRLNTATNVPLATLTSDTGLTLPLTGNPPEWLVPARTSSVSVAAKASLPVMFD